jgi:DNA-binding NarL/FixJ family response regulator
MTGGIRVLVVDDQAIVRDGLVAVLSLLPDIDVVGEAENGEIACRLVDELSPDVVLMDLRMPVLDGIEATKRIAAEHPGVGVLVLTTFAEQDSVLEALRAGARGYLTKDAGRSEIAAAVRAVASGHTTLGAEIGAALFAQNAGAPVPTGARDAADPPESLAARFSLTPREAEVLALVGDGLSNGEIADRLFVGVSTVKTHINALFAKLGVRNRAQAMALLRGR